MLSRYVIAAAALAAALAFGGASSYSWAQSPAESPQGNPPPATTPAQTPAQQPPPQAPEPPAQPQRPLDLVVSVTMATGKVETFHRQIDEMEIITRPDGGLEMIHLVLVAGGERNTHVWYNYSQVAKLSYRFVTAEGKKKVKVRVLNPSVPTRSLTDRLEPLSPEEYR
ncbi:MAG: hypothetical protein O2807_09595 [bacterium]|nr:hypothetical protein [bacterium]